MWGSRTLLLVLLLVGTVVSMACATSDAGSPPAAQVGRERHAGEGAAAGRLRVRPGEESRGGSRPEPGVRELAVSDGRPALLFVPSAAARGRPVPLVVVLHGAGGSARSGLDLLRDVAGEAGVALLAPASRGRTWDVLTRGYGPDVSALDALLRRVFAELSVDASRLVIAGFSDGASYALSLGLINGDLFTHLVAFSPGFAAPTTRRERPLIYATHGVGDEVLPIGHTSRRLVPLLRRAGHRVRYREFPGGHTVPPELARDAVAWVLGR